MKEKTQNVLHKGRHCRDEPLQRLVFVFKQKALHKKTRKFQENSGKLTGPNPGMDEDFTENVISAEVPANSGGHRAGSRFCAFAWKRRKL